MTTQARADDVLAFLATFARFPLSLRRFLASPPTLEDANRLVIDRLNRRAANFRELVDRSVYAFPGSPYLALLKQARCEQGDLHTLIERQGVEGALVALRAAGVFVTFEEFKGRRPIVRNGAVIPVTPRDFDNPASRHDITLTTGGSTGLANVVYQDLDHIADLAINEMITLAAHGVLGAPTVHWTQILPSSGIRYVLQRARHGRMPQEWFSPSGWRDSNSWRRYGLATLYLLAWTRLLGVRVGLPRVARPEDALTVARAVRATIDRHGQCLLRATVSGAVRVSLAARDSGFDLTGAVVRVASEPVTPVKRKQIEDAGLSVIAGYGSIETGAIGLGCLHPADADDVHLIAHAFALITHPHEVRGTGTIVSAFSLTGLRATAPKIMLNCQLDDCGVAETRPCGCALEIFGTTHLHSIRSYGKLVGEGVTLIGNELLPIMEEALPARFGGSPLDYQVVEREYEGLTKVVLIVSPRVQIDDEERVVQFVLDRLRASSPMADAARVVWQRMGTLRVERGEPILTARGKFSPLHVERRGSAGPVRHPAERSRP